MPKKEKVKRQPKITITLSSRQRKYLKNITAKGKHSARVIRRAQALLGSAKGMTDLEISKQIDTAVSTVERIRYRFEEGGVERAIFDAPRPGQPEKFDDKNEAFLVATACSEAPEGSDHWTLEMIREKLAKEKQLYVSKTAIWIHLRNRGIKPWLEKNVVHSGSNPGFHK